MSETMSYQGGQHSWFAPTQGEPVVLSVGAWKGEGWRVEEDGGRFEVYYHTNERMRFGADGSLSFGRPEGYWFNTREWAELCKRRMESLDRAFGRYAPGLTLDTSGDFRLGVTPANRDGRAVFQIKANASHTLLEIDKHGQVTKFDLPAFFMAWWRGMTVYRAWRVLMWGEKA